MTIIEKESLVLKELEKLDIIRSVIIRDFAGNKDIVLINSDKEDYLQAVAAKFGVEVYRTDRNQATWAIKF